MSDLPESNAVEIVFDQPETEQDKPVEQAPVTETAEEKPETPSEEKTAEPKTFTQAELDEIVQKRINKLERKMERQRIEADTRAKVQQEMAAKPEVAQGKPDVSQYTDYADYLEALADYKAEQKYESLKQADAQKVAKEAEQSEASRVSERQTELIEEGERKYDDFEDVVKSDKNNYSRAAFLAILESDNKADIVYHLAKHPEEAAKIAALPAYAQAKEIGKLEDRLSAKAPTKSSNAPSPVTPISGSKAMTKSYENMTIAEMEADARKRGARWVR